MAGTFSLSEPTIDPPKGTVVETNGIYNRENLGHFCYANFWVPNPLPASPPPRVIKSSA